MSVRFITMAKTNLQDHVFMFVILETQYSFKIEHFVTFFFLILTCIDLSAHELWGFFLLSGFLVFWDFFATGRFEALIRLISFPQYYFLIKKV